MTCHFNSSDTTMDVYDHNGDLVAEDYSFSGSWSGRYPVEVLDALREAMDGNQPSAYNQQLLADMASDNIHEGTPETS